MRAAINLQLEGCLFWLSMACISRSQHRMEFQVRMQASTAIRGTRNTKSHPVPNLKLLAQSSHSCSSHNPTKNICAHSWTLLTGPSMCVRNCNSGLYPSGPVKDKIAEVKAPKYYSYVYFRDPVPSYLAPWTIWVLGPFRKDGTWAPWASKMHPDSTRLLATRLLPTRLLRFPVP